jgi:hypothetical protein
MTMPEWRRRRLEVPVKPLGDWWKRRHHCSDVVLGASHGVDKTHDTRVQSASDPLRQGRPR